MTTIVGALPTIIKNGDAEDATVVMSLFAFIQAQVNANACPATAGTAILKGDGVGGTSNATANADYFAPSVAETTIACAAVMDVGAGPGFQQVTGSTGPVTSFGTTYRGPRFLRFLSAGAVLTHDATALILPGGVNITVAAGDRLIAYPKATVPGTSDGWEVVLYQRAAGVVVLGDIAASGLTTATSTILGRATAGTGAIEELTPAQARALIHTSGTSQVFLANGTYTKPAGLLFAIVEVQGAGGGGGGSSVSASVGGGGGAGAYGWRRLAAASIGATETVTIGAAGAAGSAAGGAGGTGGTSSFGALVSCTGGVGGGGATGVSYIAGGAGGTSTGGDVNCRGEIGGSSTANATNGYGFSGLGASSRFGGNGANVTNNADAAGGAALANSGSGGGGGSAGGSARTGGAGGTGIVIVWEFY